MVGGRQTPEGLLQTVQATYEAGLAQVEPKPSKVVA